MARFKFTFLVVGLVALVLCAIADARAGAWDDTTVALLAMFALTL
jgi:hypothetical protein